VSANNLYRYLRELVPQPALQIATVISVSSDNTSTVEFPDGSRQVARGTIVAVGSPAFVRNGVVEGLAPARTATVIEI
jgi:hypothetical protein